MKSINNFNWVFNRGDTLQGSLNTFQSCYYVFYYDLDIKIEPGLKEISGTTTIHFIVKEPTDKIQIDLNPSLITESIEWAGKQLKFSREYNAVLIQFQSSSQRKQIKSFQLNIKAIHWNLTLKFQTMGHLYGQQIKQETHGFNQSARDRSQWVVAQ